MEPSGYVLTLRKSSWKYSLQQFKLDLFAYFSIHWSVALIAQRVLDLNLGTSFVPGDKTTSFWQYLLKQWKTAAAKKDDPVFWFAGAVVEVVSGRGTKDAEVRFRRKVISHKSLATFVKVDEKGKHLVETGEKICGQDLR